MKGKQLVTIGLSIIILGAALVCYPIYHVASAEIEAEPVGLMGMGEDNAWVVVKSDGVSKFELEYIGFGCYQKTKGDCVSGLSLSAPKVGTHYTLVGNQKWSNGKDQDIRWSGTIEQVCHVYMPKLKLCPPCPVCEPEQDLAGLCSPDGCQ